MEKIAIDRVNLRYATGLDFILSFFFIWVMIFPLVFLDICVELYHHVCFPLFGIQLVPRRRYIRIDRHRLQYLTGLSKLNCVYCGYANGLIHYVSVICAMTELYWCPIQHRKGEDFQAPRHHQRFATYGEITSLKQILEKDRTDPKLIDE